MLHAGFIVTVHRGHDMDETFEVDEGYWQALLQDAEAICPAVIRRNTAAVG
jgi:hypothetical protein